jgi:hypothetical protein
MKPAKKQGPQRAPRHARQRGQHHKKETRELCKLQFQCPHCQAGLATMMFCGQYRVCAVCDSCGVHTLMGGRVAK